MKLYARLDERNAILARAGFVCLAIFPVLVLLMLLDDRLLTGVNIWLKPSKFALSIGVYLWTMAWLFSELRRRKWLLTSLALAIAAAMLIEQSLITLQAARGTTSHFNVSTPFDATVFSLMGMGVAVNSSAAAVVLLLFCFERDGERPGYMWGIRSGLMLFLLGSLEGFAMIQNAAHTVGSPDGGPGIALLNWSTSAGDLRIAHFVGIHAIQVLPFLGYLVDRSPASVTTRRLAVSIAAFAYAVLGTLTYQQALLGKPAFF
ncbi:MAG: hypothetical protein H0W33_03870 [Gammaproteobacteria bacterium]|nr:hypothetical protein [Gammaproteobacteria bacterium]